jgi:hypothetical protein
MDEVREGRVRMSRECGHDASKLIAQLREYDRKYAAQVDQYKKTHPAREVVVHTA